MCKTRLIAVVVAAAVGMSETIGTHVAFAKSDKAAKVQHQEYQKFADPKMRDECVKKARQSAEEPKAKASKGTKKAKNN